MIDPTHPQRLLPGAFAERDNPIQDSRYTYSLQGPRMYLIPSPVTENVPLQVHYVPQLTTITSSTAVRILATPA